MLELQKLIKNYKKGNIMKTLLLLLLLTVLSFGQVKNTYLAVDAVNVVQGVITVTTDSSFTGLRFLKFNGDNNPLYIQTRTYDGQNLVEWQPPKQVLTVQEFLDRFTNVEIDALLSSNTVAAQKLLLLLRTADEINLLNDKLISAVNGLNVITSDRKSIILSY